MLGFLFIKHCLYFAGIQNIRPEAQCVAPVTTITHYVVQNGQQTDVDGTTNGDVSVVEYDAWMDP